MSDTFIIHTDGGSRGNPGPAAYAYTIEPPGGGVVEEKGYLGDTTNNIAEYSALVKALGHALELGAKSVIVNSDSELLVQQMNGRYKVKNAGLLPYFREARRLADEFDEAKIRHIYREHNSRADRLCNDALDDRHSLPVTDVLTKKPAAIVAAVVPKKDDPRTAAIAVLRDAAQAWSDNEPDAPTPEQIWDRLESLRRTTK